MTLFLSTFVNKIDKKGRISVPASFRQALAQQSFQGIVFGRISFRQGMGIERMQRLSACVDELDLFSDMQDDRSDRNYFR